ncbi:phosphatidylserine decarboxylase [Archaeoglobus profundus]|uniref:Phosphatidylserine decarboxylase related protein n=1 Tax=Archaeoglobus profundus (strain DSM 5631 / JCM 9629 / NBRC 100127 / Av18) TaxID=572546 RepID=D2RI06_ARCPA|nr:phosphatidylserine decarboxylase [Archaeoglobus profundus]ADB57931.1 phosphatidylserine decarboxylase related protein [Archaeoglobus profundus DSM 5631]
MIVKQGLKFIALEFLLLPLALLSPYLLIILLPIIALTILFFRDPDRGIEDGVVSPADGKIDYVNDRRLEIFMSIFDCHVNRSPVDGIVRKIVYSKGSKLPAFMRHTNSERNEIYIETDHGTFKVVQIAGFLARRIICFVKEGERVRKGEKIGMIVMGSRVVIEIPEGFKFVKRVGDRVKAGETIAVKA